MKYFKSCYHQLYIELMVTFEERIINFVSVKQNFDGSLHFLIRQFINHEQFNLI